MDVRALADHYSLEGWAVVRELIDAETVAHVLAAAQTLIDGAASLEHDTTQRGVTFQVQSASGRTGEPAVAPGALRKVMFPSKAPGQVAFIRLRRDPRMLAMLVNLGLTSPRCLVDQLNIKLPRLGTGFPFHQDAPFLVPRTRRLLDEQGGVNAVIALDASDAGNGTLQVLGRTHRQGLVPFDYDTSGMNEGVFDESRRTTIALAPGDTVFFHPLLAHGSGPNPSDRPRRMVTLWFAGGPGQG